MGFHHQDIHRFLQESIPARFGQLGPYEFKEFIGYLFEKDGFTLRSGVDLGEMSHILLADKGGSSHVILPWHAPGGQPAGVTEVKKIMQAQTFFQADQAWIVTTSTVDPEGKKLAKESETEIWEWADLYEALCALFFDGKSHEEDPGPTPIQNAADLVDSDLKMKVQWQAAEGVSAEWFNLGITISNPSDRNVYIHLELPALIDQKKQQIMAEEWVQGEFVAGMIYAGASVRTNALYAVSKVGDRPPGGRVVLTCHERQEIPVTYHLQARLKGEACFVVTYCYGRQSLEYHMMTQYRDQVLNRKYVGRMMVRVYYVISPRILNFASRNRWIDYALRKIVAFGMPFFVRYLLKKNSA